MILPYRKGENVEEYLTGLSQQLIQTLKPEVWEGLPRSATSMSATVMTAPTLAANWTGTAYWLVWESAEIGMISGSLAYSGGAVQGVTALTLGSYLPTHVARGAAMWNDMTTPTFCCAILSTTGALSFQSTATSDPQSFAIWYRHDGA